MIPGSLARRYARALLDLADSPAKRDKFLRDLTTLSDVARQRDETGHTVLSVLAAERFSVTDRRHLLETLCSRVMADPMTVRFLALVLEKGRIDGLPDIARAYERLADEAAGRMRAHVTSATPLPPEAQGRLKAALEQATRKTVVLTASVDPELIGGLVTQVGSYVIDGSVRQSLAQLRASMRA